MAVLSWWIDLFDGGWLGAVAASWIAATAVPLLLLGVLTLIERGKVIMRRNAGPTRLLPTRDQGLPRHEVAARRGG